MNGSIRPFQPSLIFVVKAKSLTFCVQIPIANDENFQLKIPKIIKI